MSLEARRKRSEAWDKSPKRLRSILCLCGCDQQTTPGRKYAHGHFTKIQWQQRNEKDKVLLAEKIAKSLRGRSITEIQKAGLAIGWSGINIGENHWNWKGGPGRSYPKEYRHFRSLILERDGHRCVQCSAEIFLVVHHIDGNKSHNCWLNLVTLCDRCNHKAEAKANKSIWSTNLRIYTEAISPKENPCLMVIPCSLA